MSDRPWFRCRRGRGWRPASWLVTIAAVATVAAFGFIFRADSLGVVIVLTYLAILAVILFFRGGPGK